jgi:hypothetical protein
MRCSELPPEQREIFELTELDDIPVKEISEITDVPVNTLLSRKRYAMKHLRKRLEGLCREIVYSYFFLPYDAGTSAVLDICMKNCANQ